MLTGTDEYNRMSEERNAKRFGVESFHTAPSFDDEVLEYVGKYTFFGFSSREVQRFCRMKITFTYEGRKCHYLSAPIIEVKKESTWCSSSIYAVLDEDKMQEVFQKQLEELKESIRNDPEFNTDKRQPN